MDDDRTTIEVQRYLDQLAVLNGESDAEPVISALLGRSARRLQLLCSALLHRSYPRLTRPPLGLAAEELLGAVVERLLRALRQTRPETVRGFFALAGKHMRWELNDLARRLDEEGSPVDIREYDLAAPESSDGGLGAATRRMLDAIEELPEEEREVFDLVRIHGLTHEKAAEVLKVSTKTVQRRLNRALHMLTEALADLGPSPHTGRGMSRQT
jgi:RNA polymerase sigma-70 factor (ECF subfamily)